MNTEIIITNMRGGKTLALRKLKYATRALASQNARKPLHHLEEWTFLRKTIYEK